MDYDLYRIDWGVEITKLRDTKKELLKQKDSIERQIEAADRAIESLLFLGNPGDNLPQEGNIRTMGVQDGVRALLRRGYPVSLTPPEIKDLLVSAGITRANLLIEVHTAITRMKDKGEVEETSKNGKKSYRWKQPESK